MRSLHPANLCLCLIAAVPAWLAGCAIPTTTARANPAANSTAEEVPRDATQATTPQRRVRVPDRSAGPQDAIDFAGTTPRRRTDGVGMLGIYGELAGNTIARQPSDGTDNLRQVTSISHGDIFDPDVNQDGSQIVVASTMHARRADLYTKTPSGSTFTQLTDDPADDVMPAFSPDGERIAFASNRTGDWNIFIMSASGGPATQLTFENDHELHPTWSPDGRTIAYCRFGNVSGRWEIWTIDVENPTVRRFLVYGMFPQWNPDPATPKLLFQRARQRGSRYHSVWTIDYVGGEAKRPTEIVSAANAGVINPCWSPDGQHISFVTVVDPHEQKDTRPQQCDLWIVDVNGANRTALTHGRHRNYQPVWSSDGSVYFISNRSGTENLWAVAATEHIQTNGQSEGQVATVDPAGEEAGSP